MADSVALVDAIAERGFLKLAPGSLATAQHLATTLGKVLLRTEVRLNPKVSTYLCQPGAIPPHTDHPAARFILWYCQVADDGPNRLIDARSALSMLHPVQRTAIERLRFDCPPFTSERGREEHPLWDCLTQKFFFAAWCAHAADSAAVRRAEAFFLGATQAQQSVHLKPGEALLIDNHRLLHFRDALSPTSARWLTRWWIAAPAPAALG